MAGKTATKPQAGMRNCKYCGTSVSRRRGAMGSHVLTCDMAPKRVDEGSLPPGTIVDQGTGAPRKIRWTPSDVLKVYPKETWKTIIPMRSQLVTWNGIPIYFHAGIEMRVPPIFYDIYMESWRADQDIISPRQPRDAERRMVPYEGSSPLMIMGIGPLRESA